MKAPNVLQLSLCTFFLATVAVAQTSPSTGAIKGTVKDPSGALIADADVALSSEVLGIRRVVTTQSDGGFLFPLLPPASGYEVVVTQSGFARVLSRIITVQLTDVTTTVNVRRTIGQRNEVVSVTAPIEVVQTSNPILGATLNGEVVAADPSTKCP